MTTGLLPHRGRRQLWQANTAYAVGDLVAYGGRFYRATVAIPAGVPPRGAGDGSAFDRGLLLARCVGAGATTRGGLSGPTYTVTRLDDYDPDTDSPVSGTLRYGVEGVGLTSPDDPRWIVFDPGLGSAPTVQLGNDALRVTSYKTIDARACSGGVEVRPSASTTIDRNTIEVFAGTRLLANNSVSQGRGRDLSHVIIHGLRVVAPVDTNPSTCDGIAVLGSSPNPATQIGFTFAYGWVDHCSITSTMEDTGNGIPKSDDLINVGNQADRVTLSWSKLGPYMMNDGSTQQGKAAAFGATYGFNAGLRWSMHHCFTEHVNARSPRVADGGYLHLWNCYDKWWGTGSGSVCANEGHLRAENCVWQPIEKNDPRRTIPGTGADLNDAEKRGFGNISGAQGNGKGKSTGHWLISNGFGDAPTVTETDPDNVFIPDYSYTLDTANQALLDQLTVDAGAVSPWRLL